MTFPHAMLPSSESLFNVCLRIIIACSGRVMAVGLEAKRARVAAARPDS